ncbi:hypothetical protein PanWU01x14_286220, partial [Parasponia andersonii]
KMQQRKFRTKQRRKFTKNDSRRTFFPLNFEIFSKYNRMSSIPSLRKTATGLYTSNRPVLQNQGTKTLDRGCRESVKVRCSHTMNNSLFLSILKFSQNITARGVLS